MKGQLVAVTAGKGGVGKTTIATNLSVGLTRKGKSVLLADFDYQANVASRFGMQPRDDVHHYMAQEWSADMCIVAAQNGERTWPGLSLMLGSERTKTTVRNVLAELSEGRLMDDYVDRLRSLMQQYDFVVVDTPPGTVLSEIALHAADYVVVPCIPAHDAIAGMRSTVRLAHRLGKTTAQVLVAPTDYDRRQRVHTDLLAEIQQEASAIVLEPIRRRAAVQEAETLARDFWSYPKASDAAADIAALVALVAANLQQEEMHGFEVQDA